MRFTRGLHAGLLAALALLALPAGADLKGGQQALRTGQWTEAETQFKAAPPAEKGPAALGLAELYQTTGRCDEALKRPQYPQPSDFRTC